MNPLKLIRIVNNKEIKDIADIFNVSSEYIIDVENDKEEMKYEVLCAGLKKLNISYDDYMELKEFIDKATKADISSEEMFARSLAKAMGISYKYLKRKADEIAIIPRRDSLLLKKQRDKTKVVIENPIITNTKEPYQSFSSLKLIRDARCITTKEMAASLGVTVDQFHKIENGDKNVTLKKINSLELSVEEYNSLVEFMKEISNKELPYQTKYNLSLLKAMDIVMKGNGDYANISNIDMKPATHTNFEIYKPYMYTPLRLIRKVKYISIEDMASAFSLDFSSMNDLLKGKMVLDRDALYEGLINIGIDYIDYLELKSYISDIIKEDGLNRKTYQKVLTKTIGIINPNFKAIADKKINEK